MCFKILPPDGFPSGGNLLAAVLVLILIVILVLVVILILVVVLVLILVLVIHSMIPPFVSFGFPQSSMPQPSGFILGAKNKAHNQSRYDRSCNAASGCLKTPGKDPNKTFV